MIFEDNLLEDLWLNEKSFAYFFVNGKGHWVIDHKYNYHLDLEETFARINTQKSIKLV